MVKSCKHCGSPYSQSKGQGDYCCAGCEHVYSLIQKSGFEDYYALQDRAGRPVGDTPFDRLESASINKLQKQAEDGSGCRLTLSLKGMSCMGCAWLVEHLCQRQEGVLSAKVALGVGCLSINWKPGDFDLSKLARELHDFGYTISGDAASAGLSVSPLALRFGLTLVFSLNGLLLAIAATMEVGSDQLQPLYVLLISLCLLFAQLIGGSLFLVPAWRGLLLRRIHADLLPAAVLLFLFGLAFASLFIAGAWTEYIYIYFISLPLMVLLRWLSALRILRTATTAVG